MGLSYGGLRIGEGIGLEVGGGLRFRLEAIFTG